MDGEPDLRLVPGENPLRALEQGGACPEPVEELRELKTDVPAADDDERPRLLGQLRRLVGVEMAGGLRAYRVDRT